jgi:hypothetical protein
VVGGNSESFRAVERQKEAEELQASFQATPTRRTSVSLVKNVGVDARSSSTFQLPGAVSDTLGSAGVSANLATSAPDPVDQLKQQHLSPEHDDEVSAGVARVTGVRAADTAPAAEVPPRISLPMQSATGKVSDPTGETERSGGEK